MFEHEYSAFISTGVPPTAERRPCVLCIRYLQNLFVLALRAPSPVRRYALDRSSAFQLYYNLRDSPGGYFGQFMMTPLADRWEGFVRPIVMFRKDLLLAMRDHVSGRWVVKQDPMVYKESSRAGIRRVCMSRDHHETCEADGDVLAL
jgi:hypothetical protein